MASFISVNTKSNLNVNIRSIKGLSAKQIAYEVSRVLGVDPVIYFFDGGDGRQRADTQFTDYILNNINLIIQDKYQRLVTEKNVQQVAMVSA